jgi:hypothetical protein
MHVRRANTEDAAAACAVLRRSITELCHADHGGDEVILGKWLSNKTVENVARWIRQSHGVVSEEAGTLLGVAAMTGSGKITLNYVSPEARFRGVSKALVQQLEEQASAIGLSVGDYANGAPLLPEPRLCQERGELPAFTDGNACDCTSEKSSVVPRVRSTAGRRCGEAREGAGCVLGSVDRPEETR